MDYKWKRNFKQSKIVSRIIKMTIEGIKNVNFLRGLIISTLVLAVLVSLQIYWALPNIIGLFLWLFIMFLFISVAASARYIAANPQDKKKRKVELIISAILAVISLIILFIVVANVR
ncbi:hypothetical protein CYJ87_04945 [Lactobacillus gasseri]|nr:hypothetical protein CYJ87_04945 [Lactobacillus gasseri]